MTDLFDTFHRLNLERNKQTWPLCFVSSKIIGQYERGQTAELADREGVSVASIQHWAHAGSCYVLLVKQGITRQIRDELSVSHFAAAYEVCGLRDRPENAQTAATLLHLALDPPDGKEKWSSQDMRDYARAHIKQVQRSPKRLLERIWEWIELSDLPQDVKSEAMDLLRQLTHKLKGG